MPSSPPIRDLTIKYRERIFCDPRGNIVVHRMVGSGTEALELNATQVSTCFTPKSAFYARGMDVCLRQNILSKE